MRFCNKKYLKYILTLDWRQKRLILTLYALYKLIFYLFNYLHSYKKNHTKQFRCRLLKYIQVVYKM